MNNNTFNAHPWDFKCSNISIYVHNQSLASWSHHTTPISSNELVSPPCDVLSKRRVQKISWLRFMIFDFLVAVLDVQLYLHGFIHVLPSREICKFLGHLHVRFLNFGLRRQIWLQPPFNTLQGFSITMKRKQKTLLIFIYVGWLVATIHVLRARERYWKSEPDKNSLIKYIVQVT